MSTHVKLNAEKRELTGNSVRKLRKSGVLPAVVFGKNKESDVVQVKYNEFVKVFKEAGKTHVIDLIIDKKTQPCIIHDMDIDPVKSIPRHVDFLSVNLKEKITTEVPLELIGEAPAVKEFGGIVFSNVESVQVSALPDDLPEQIKLDISKLTTIGSYLKVSDINVDGKFEVVTESDTIIVTVVSQTVESESTVTSEEESDTSAVSNQTE